MEELFVSYELAVELKELGLNKKELGVHFTTDGKNWQLVDIFEFSLIDETYLIGQNFILNAPTYQQAIDWFQEEHDIYIGRTGYNDKKTPKRWVYHVDNYYVQDQSFEGAIKYAIELIKINKIT